MGVLPEGNLQNNSLASNKCFSYRNVFQKGIKALSKMVLEKPGFWSKSLEILVVSPHDFVKKRLQTSNISIRNSDTVEL